MTVGVATPESRGAFGATDRNVFGVWTFFGLLFASATYWEVRTHGHSTAKIFVYVLLVWYAWALATPVVAWAGRRWPIVPFSPRTAVMHGLVASGLAAAHLTWWAALAVWIRPYDAMGMQTFQGVMRDGVKNRSFFEIIIYVAVLGTTYTAEYRRRLRAREIAAVQLEASLAQARLSALELQLQPHFLFNALHAVGGLVRQNRSQQAIETISALSDVLRYALDSEGRHVVRLERELEVLSRYLDIQRIRFADRLTTAIDAPDNLRNAEIPSMLLQPLAENAIRHGIEASSEPGSIELSVCRREDTLRIEMFNSGELIGVPRPRIGLLNTRERLERLYGSAHALVLENARGGVVARVEIPFREATQ